MTHTYDELKASLLSRRILQRPSIIINAETGMQVFHAVMVDHDTWDASGPEFTGILVLDSRGLISMMANIIAEDTSAISLYPNTPPLYIDHLGNTWVDDTYTGPTEYLPKLIERAKEVFHNVTRETREKDRPASNGDNRDQGRSTRIAES